MKKIILYYHKTMYEEGINYFHVPYSILSLTTLYSDVDVKFQLIDRNICNFENYQLFKDAKEILCVGISSMIGHQIRDALNFSKFIKKTNPSIPVIWGGALPTILPNETIENEYIDVIVRGQGELSFKDLVYSLLKSQSFENISGISFKMNNKIIHNPDRHQVKVANLPSYKNYYQYLDIDKYIRNDRNINTITVSYHSSQGCVYNCGFCCEAKLWNRTWTGFSINQIKADIDCLIDDYNINGIKFYDSEFFIDRKRTIDFAKYLIFENKNIKWGAAINPINFLRFAETEIELFSKSGLSRLMIGIESICNNKNNLINKPFIKESSKKICNICSDNDIAICFSLIIGFPNESEGIIIETIEFAQSLRNLNPRNEIQINFYSP